MSGAVFQEVQSFRLKRQFVLLAIPPAGMTFLFVWQVVLGHAWGKQPLSNPSVMGGTIFLWLVYARLVTVRLVTRVHDGELAVGLRGLWRARRIPLSQIQSAEAITYDPLRDYGGYGIRTARHGAAYIAGGNRGVQLELVRGGSLLIGSARPDDLLSAVKGESRG